MGKFSQLSHFTVWKLIRTYWQSKHKLGAYLLYSLLVFLTVAVVVTEVGLTYWSNYFYDSLQAYNKSAAVRLLGYFFLLAFLYIFLVVNRYYFSQWFGLRWRRWLTKKCIGRWLHGRGYYYLENFDEATDNPDQRIQDDVGGLVSNSIDLSIGFIGNACAFIGYGYVLWNLSGDLAIPLGTLGTLYIKKYLVWVSVIYTLIGTLITFKIGRELVPLNFEQQRREATFRFAAIDLRSHAENVALYHGEHQQSETLKQLFRRVLDNWYQIIVRQTKLLSFTAGFGQLSVALPLIVVLPNYFSKVILLGGLIQSLRAFSGLQDALSFFVNSYPQIAVWRATGQRLTTFLNHLGDIELKTSQENNVDIKRQTEDAIITKGLTISTPRDEVLLKNVDLKFTHGNNYLIKGVSGIGKSTFVRTVAGIWPFATGQILFPENQKVMFLPQKPYMPLGTLAEAIVFPDELKPGDDIKIAKVLKDCKLDALIPRLNEMAHWSEQLSPGEQQRISFARVLLQKPDWVFLDESTSMLDLGNEESFYKLLKTQLPNCCVVSIGHHPSLEEHHNHIIDMAEYVPIVAGVV